MTDINIHTIDAETALAEEIVAAVIAHMGRDARLAYDDEGDVAGITYYADETAQWYGADLDDCRRYIRTVRETRGVDSYSIWCGSTSPTGEADTREECLAEMEWAA